VLGGAFASSATQHGGQETTPFNIITNLLHFGMTVVGLNYGFAGRMKVDEITGGVPYGATTIAGLDAQRQPSENELAGSRYQVRAIAETAAKLHGGTTRSERGRALAASAAQSSGAGAGSVEEKADGHHNARLSTSWRDVISHWPPGIPYFDGTVLIQRTAAKRELCRCCPGRSTSAARRSSLVKAARLAGALRDRELLRRSTLGAGYEHVFSDLRGPPQ
jgi:hypothetical protein